MADEAHLEILRSGAEVWNQWRGRNPEICPDLNKADLRGAVLVRANLTYTDLRGADLREADLRGAYLRNSDLRSSQLAKADLSGASLIKAGLRAAGLREADLREADFNEASLCEADLQEAALHFANLSRAQLHEANSSETKLSGTIFTDNDLSKVKGLETVRHLGPSTVSVDTLLKSRGNIPPVFLRGCGLSDWQIEAAKLYNPDLTNEQVGDILYRVHDLRAQRLLQINSLFISYSHADGSFVDHIEDYLERDGIRFWRDVHHATAGRLERQVDRAMRLNPTVLLVLSTNAVESDWVEHEVRLARKLEKETGRDVLCPVALDGSWKACRWPERLREQVEEYNILDFSQWHDGEHFGRMYRRLLEGLDLFYRKEGA